MNAAKPVLPVGRIIAEGQSLFDVDNGVDPKACQALVKPPVDVFIDFLPEFGIFPV